jgi:lipopolysaccharide biosynthesis glycosyltransferase
VACAADEAYAPHAAAMLSSVFASNPRGDIRAHVLHPAGLSRKAIDGISRMIDGYGGSVEFYDAAEPGTHDLPAMDDISNVMWYRLALPELLPNIRRVLYLDCDTLVLSSLSPLWDLDLGGEPVGAVTNVFPPYLVHRPDDLGVPRAEYFNSGVLLMDLDAWRSRALGEQILQLARSEPARLIFPDQDALNVELHTSWYRLHPRWNCQNGIFYFRTAEALIGAAQVAEARAHPAILHFEGRERAKPWHYLSTHPYRQRYLDHRERTPWPVVELEGRTFQNMLRRHLPVRVRAAISRSRAIAERAIGAGS